MQIEENDTGILIGVRAPNNVVTSSFLLRNASFGIVIAGSNNTIDLSTKVSQSAVGIQVLFSDGNTIRATSSSQNDVYGIQLELAENTTIQSSDASNNGDVGIKVDARATSNLIMSNKAFGNGSFDLEDDNPACDDNTWKSNQFGTAYPGCIS